MQLQFALCCQVFLRLQCYYFSADYFTSYWRTLFHFEADSQLMVGNIIETVNVLDIGNKLYVFAVTTHDTFSMIVLVYLISIEKSCMNCVQLLIRAKD